MNKADRNASKREDSDPLRAEADEPVYITEVRKAFSRDGACAFHIHADLYEGQTAVFPLSLPEWEEAERQFIRFL